MMAFTCMDRRRALCHSWKQSSPPHSLQCHRLQMTPAQFETLLILQKGWWKVNLINIDPPWLEHCSWLLGWHTQLGSAGSILKRAQMLEERFSVLRLQKSFSSLLSEDHEVVQRCEQLVEGTWSVINVIIQNPQAVSWRHIWSMSNVIIMLLFRPARVMRW